MDSRWLGSKHIFVGEARVATKNGYGGENSGYERQRQYWYHGDHLGSAQVISNWQGNEHERIEYTPHGELWIEKRNAESNGLDVPYRFTGKERDEETGLYYYGARYLDGRTAMWLSTDPALGEYLPEAPINDEARERNGNLPGMGGVFNTVNLHLYHYAGNNPVKYTDPDGKFIFTTALFFLGQISKPFARMFIDIYAISIGRMFFKNTAELYSKARSGDTSVYSRGPDSTIAIKMGNDKKFHSMVSRHVNNNFAEGGGVVKNEDVTWKSKDLQLAIGGLDGGFSWAIDSYDAKTGVADITVTVNDKFNFNKWERGFPK
jgi:RHS repeat-associated protein